MRDLLKSCLLMLLCLSFSSVVSFADDAAIKLSKKGFKIGFDAVSFNYEEPGVMEDDGSLYGLFASYSVHGVGRLMGEVSLNYVWGSLAYDGGVIDVTSLEVTPLKDDTDERVFEFRALIGYDNKLKNSMTLTPFTGYGYRYLNDELDHPLGYEREIQYWYLPIGVKVFGPLTDDRTWGMSVEYDLFLAGKVESHFSDVDPGYNDPENDQDFADGYGLGFSLEFNQKLSNKLSLCIEPYIKYWDIKKSDISAWTWNGILIDNVFEPENETTTYGLRLTLLI